jgi:hypothetical protein
MGLRREPSLAIHHTHMVEAEYADTTKGVAK